MVPIKEALTFDDVTLAPKYSEILPSEVNTEVKLAKNLNLKIPLLSSAMDTVTESKMAIAIAKSGGIGVIHRNLDIKNQILEIKKVKKQKLLVGAAVGAGPNEFKRAETIIKEGVSNENIPSFIVKENQLLISISDVNLAFIVENHMSQIFSILAKNRVGVNLMQLSAISFSVNSYKSCNGR